MNRAQRRLLLLIAAVPVLVLLTALVYMQAMAALEGTPRSFWDSVEWAGETLSTTGYGWDAHWTHPLMIVFVVTAQFVGVFLVFLIIPIYLIPILEERFESRPPRKAPKELKDHVLVYRYGPAVERVLEQLETRHIPFLVVETDEERARQLKDDGLPVVYARSVEESLDAGAIERARTLVANGPDQEDAALTLGARQRGFEGEIVALVEEPLHHKPLVLAGASSVFTPRHVLARALAARASTQISLRISGIQQLGSLEVREIRLQRDSSLAGRTLGDTDLGARTGTTVVGQWVGGELQVQPTAEMRLEPRGILVVLGTPENLDRLADLCAGARPLARTGRFVVCGFGEVGRKVHQLLTDGGEEVFVIDRKPLAGVDLVGDAVSPAVLEEARIETARGVILALDSDDLTVFSAVIVQDMAPDAPVIARVNQAANVEKIHRAGADFALSLAQVSSQILARRLLGEEALVVDPQLKIIKVAADGIAGRRPADLGIRERTGCSVVAVEREDGVLVELDADLRFQDGDVIYLCGSEAAVHSFTETYSNA